VPPIQQQRAVRPQTKSRFQISVGDAVGPTSQNARQPANLSQGAGVQTNNGIANMLFNVFEGGEETVANSEYNDGVSNRVLHLSGLVSISEVTIRKPYNPRTDLVIYQWFDRLKHAQPGVSVSISPVEYAPGTEEATVLTELQTVFTDCIITSVNTPSVDRMSSDSAELEIKFRPNYVTRPNASGAGGTGTGA